MTKVPRLWRDRKTYGFLLHFPKEGTGLPLFLTCLCPGVLYSSQYGIAELLTSTIPFVLQVMYQLVFHVLVCSYRVYVILHCSLSHLNLASYCAGWTRHCPAPQTTELYVFEQVQDCRIWSFATSIITGSCHRTLKTSRHLEQFCCSCLPSRTTVSIQFPHLWSPWTSLGAQVLLCSWAALLTGPNSFPYALGFRKWYT